MQVRSGQIAANRCSSVGWSIVPGLLPEVQDGLLLAAVKRRWRSRHCCFQLFPWLPPPQSPDKLPSSSRPSLPTGDWWSHQRCLSLEYPFASQVGIGPKVGFIHEEDLGSTLLGLLSDLAVLEDEGFPFFILGFQEGVSWVASARSPTDGGSSSNCSDSAPGQSSA